MKCPYCNRIIRNERTETNHTNRIELILSNLEDGSRLEELYRIVRKKGYCMKRRTFQRDMKSLEKNGDVRLEIKSYKRGRTSFITILR